MELGKHAVNNWEGRNVLLPVKSREARKKADRRAQTPWRHVRCRDYCCLSHGGLNMPSKIAQFEMAMAGFAPQQSGSRALARAVNINGLGPRSCGIRMQDFHKYIHTHIYTYEMDICTHIYI